MGLQGTLHVQLLKLPHACADGANVSGDHDIDPARSGPAAGPTGAVRLEVARGSVRTVAAHDEDGVGELSWPADSARVWLDGVEVGGTSCRVPAGANLRVEAVSMPARTSYVVAVSRDRMEATLRVVTEPGCIRTFADAIATPKLRLLPREERVDPDVPNAAAATAELQRAGVVHGIDPERLEQAIQTPGDEVVVAVGTDPMPGRNGYLEELVDFAELRRTGVLADTPLLRRVRKRDGVPGRDVTGRELTVPPARDARIRAGEGVSVDEHGIIATATVDGAPYLDSEGHVEVRHELVLPVVDTVSGDIEFNGSVRVEGDVGEGRRVKARDELTVEGNVDRAFLESGSSMRIAGSVMSSVLRVGGERATAAAIGDRVVELPRLLAMVAAQAREVRDVTASRGQEVSHGLTIQWVLENKQRTVLPSILSIYQDLREAGPNHGETAEQAGRWHRMLSTAANQLLTPEQYQEILGQVTALADDVRRATEHAADLVVSYMQACEVEATGTVTLVGRGIFNSRVVAWGGMLAEQHDAVFRGGSILSHGRVHVREVGSPAGAKTLVQLSAGARLEADRACAGTVVAGPGYSHRFVADRTCVRIDFDASGSMNVESLAA